MVVAGGVGAFFVRVAVMADECSADTGVKMQRDTSRGEVALALGIALTAYRRLSFYCQDDTIDAIPMAFLYIFRGKGGQPVLDFSNVSSPCKERKSMSSSIRQ
jgi:hypothetical protein